MPKYLVRWTEINHYTSEVTAATPEEAQELCMMNEGDWMEVDAGGYEEDSIEIIDVTNGYPNV